MGTKDVPKVIAAYFFVYILLFFVVNIYLTFEGTTTVGSFMQVLHDFFAGIGYRDCAFQYGSINVWLMSSRR